MGVKVDHEKCMKCGGCVVTCPFNCIFLKDKITIKDCRDCGLCIKSCPVGAIHE